MTLRFLWIFLVIFFWNGFFFFFIPKIKFLLSAAPPVVQNWFVGGCVKPFECAYLNTDSVHLARGCLEYDASCSLMNLGFFFVVSAINTVCIFIVFCWNTNIIPRWFSFLSLFIHDVLNEILLAPTGLQVSILGFLH